MTKTNERLVQTLIDAGVKRAFTFPGLGVTWSLPAYYDRRDELELFLTRSEQVASVMAQVTGRLTGKPGVLLVQGPWAATTASFGILEGHFSGSPMVIITDASDYNNMGPYGVYQSMTGDYGSGDLKAALTPITKYCAYATTPVEAIYDVQMAFKHAATPRMGPAAVILKSSVIRETFPLTPHPVVYPTADYLRYTPARPDEDAMRELATRLNAATFPVFIAGNGVTMTRTGHRLLELAKNIGAGIVTSYNGKGSVDECAPLCAGMLGNWGNVTANKVLAAADMVVALGASLAPDYTRMRDPLMIRPGDQYIAQVDVDPRNAGWVVPVDLPITGDVSDVISFLEKAGLDSSRQAERAAKVAGIKAETGYDAPATYVSKPGMVHLGAFVDVVQKFMTKDDMVTLDAGSTRIWHTNKLRVQHSDQLIVPGGIGGMGWGSPAAAAAKLVFPHKRATAIIGDGGFIMTSDVVATCSQHKLPVVFVVSNNGGLGMVRDNLGDKRYCVDFTSVDYAALGQSMGAFGAKVDKPSSFAEALREAHSQTDRPSVIEVAVDPDSSHRAASDYSA